MSHRLFAFRSFFCRSALPVHPVLARRPLRFLGKKRRKKSKANAVLTKLAAEGELEQISDLVDNMKEDGKKVDWRYPFIACRVRGGPTAKAKLIEFVNCMTEDRPQTAEIKTAVSILAEMGCWLELKKLLDEQPIDDEIMKAVMVGSSHGGGIGDALVVWDSLSSRHVPSLELYSFAMNFCDRKNTPEFSLTILKKMTQNRVLPNTALINTALRCFVRCNPHKEPAAAVHVKNLESLSRVAGVTFDCGLLPTFLYAYLRYGDFDSMQRLFASIPPEELSPSSVNCMMKVYSEINLQQGSVLARNLWKTAMSVNCLDERVLAAFQKILVREGAMQDFKKAQEDFAKLSIHPAPHWS